MDPNEALKICIKSIIICYVPNAIPADRIFKLVEFILGPEQRERLNNYGIERFIKEQLPEDASVLEGGAIIHSICKDG